MTTQQLSLLPLEVLPPPVVRRVEPQVAPVPKVVPVTLYGGSCLDVLPRLGRASIQTTFIDPPYNTGLKRKKYEKLRLAAEKNWEGFSAEWDSWPTPEAYRADVDRWIEAIRPVMTPTATIWVCGSHHSIPHWDLALRAHGFWVIQWVQWYKRNAMPNLALSQMKSSHETMIWARMSQKAGYTYLPERAKSYNKGINLHDVWDIPTDAQVARRHKLSNKSKKPPALMMRAVSISTEPGAPVLDCFAGSGSTGEAMQRLAARESILYPCTLVERDLQQVGEIEQRLHITREP